VQATLPTKICSGGFSKEFEVSLGGEQHAFDLEWLLAHGIKRVVRCIHPTTRAPSTPDLLREFIVPVEWADLGNSVWMFFIGLSIVFKDIDSVPGNILFYCKRGRRRSSCILSCWLLNLWQAEEADTVMRDLVALRQGVGFFEQAGKYPPLARVVREWRRFLVLGAQRYEDIDLRDEAGRFDKR
jgi:hypothetical protein